MTRWQIIGDLRQFRLGPPLIVLAVLTIIWELAVDANPTLEEVISKPSAIVNAMITSRESLLTQHIPQTMLETLVGLVIAFVLGIAIAALLDFSPLLKRAIYPILVTSQTIPIVALATVLILAFGFGNEPKIIVVVLFLFFPISVATIDGLNATDPDLVVLLKAIGASRWQIWRKVRFPAALPSMFSGLRIATTYAISTAIISEYIVSDQGLGWYLRLAFTSNHAEKAFAVVVIAAVLSIALVMLVNLAERLMLPWFFTSAREANWNEPGIY